MLMFSLNYNTEVLRRGSAAGDGLIMYLVLAASQELSKLLLILRVRFPVSSYTSIFHFPLPKYQLVRGNCRPLTARALFGNEAPRPEMFRVTRVHRDAQA